MGNKKVAILSVYDVYNYGSILQTYALQKVITDLGLDNTIIRNDHRSKLSQIKRCFNAPLLRMKVNFIIRDLYVRYIRRDLWEYFSSRKRSFDNFINDNLEISPDWGDRQGIAQHIQNYDFALVGSDQVWNPMNLGKDFYTMSFVPKNVKRVTYAPSFGVSVIPKKQIAETKEYLEKIDCLSVREISGKEIIKQLTGREAPVVADPTILLPVEKWEEMVVPVHPNKNKPYIFCYFLGTSKHHRDFANRLKSYTKMDIVSLPHSDEICRWDFGFGDASPHGVGPKEFINLIAHASYVCTDSFHATVFSNLFNREFFSFGRYVDSNNTASTNSRIPSLLSLLGDTERYIDSRIDISNDLLKPVDFNIVNQNILSLRHSSSTYLKQSLEIS